MMAGVGGAAAGVNGFFTSEISGDINLDWCKKAPRDICNAFRSSTFFNYCPGGGFCIGKITQITRSKLRSTRKHNTFQSNFHKDSTAARVSRGKSNNQPAVGDGLLTFVSGKIGNASLF